MDRMGSQERQPRHRKPRLVVIGMHTSSIRRWGDVLVVTASYLANAGKLSGADCPIRVVSGATCLINSIPVHPDGSPFRAPRVLQGRLYIETHYDRRHVVSYARRLLEQFGEDGGTLRVD